MVEAKRQDVTIDGSDFEGVPVSMHITRWADPTPVSCRELDAEWQCSAAWLLHVALASVVWQSKDSHQWLWRAESATADVVVRLRANRVLCLLQSSGLPSLATWTLASQQW